MDNNHSTGLPRRALLRVFAATVITATPTFASAPSFLHGAGKIRRLHVASGCSDKVMNAVYWADGQYLPEVLAEINHFFRDWRTNQEHRIDTCTIDIMAAAHRLLDVNEPYFLLSGYRSWQTSEVPRSRSNRVAESSHHALGKAADVRMRSRSVAQVARAAAACRAGGVGRYSRADFTHMDCGPVRSWGA